MKESEYITISQKENIVDENVSKIIDYLERHSRAFEFIAKDNVQVDGVVWVFQSWTGMAIICVDNNIEWDSDWTLPIKVLADNIMGIYAGVRDKKKQAS